MKKNKFYICKEKQLLENSYYVKWIEEIKDEIIIFRDKSKKIKSFSSICIHFGGEIYYDKNEDKLVCKWHNWKYCPYTGQCLTYKIKNKLKEYDFNIAPNKLKKYELKLENDKIYLALN